MQDFASKIIGKHISFPTDFEIDGRKFPGYVNWFQSISPCRNAQDEVCLEFEFSNKLKPFLLQLKEYVKLSRIDIAPMKSGFSIRIYSMLKAYRDKKRAHETESSYTVGLEDLKSTLGISGKYTAFDNFRRRVLNVAKKEINENSSSIEIDFKGIRAKRKIHAIQFIIKDRKRSSQAKLPAMKLELLSKAKLKAYQLLIAFGVFEGIAYHQIIPNIKGGGVEGFEDYFIENMLAHFKRKSKNPNPATFVNWWQQDFYSIEGGDWSSIVEQVNAAKKALQSRDALAFDNRIKAKDMTNQAFETWYKGGKE